MRIDLDRLVTKPKDWEEWIVAIFDPTFEISPRFFVGWDHDDNAMMALMVRQEHGYDQACRMSKDEAENEMRLIQGCVGPDIYVYKMPYLPSRAKSLYDITAKATPPGMQDNFKPLHLKSTITKYARFIEDPAMVMLALLTASLIATVVLL